MKFTDKERMDWICSRISYIEHNGPKGERCRDMKVGGYWPQSMAPELNPCATAIEELSDLDLEGYIDAMIELEKEKAA